MERTKVLLFSKNSVNLCVNDSLSRYTSFTDPKLICTSIV